MGRLNDGVLEGRDSTGDCLYLQEYSADSVCDRINTTVPEFSYGGVTTGEKFYALDLLKRQ